MKRATQLPWYGHDHASDKRVDLAGIRGCAPPAADLHGVIRRAHEWGAGECLKHPGATAEGPGLRATLLTYAYADLVLYFIVVGVALLGFVLVVWSAGRRRPNSGWERDDSLWPNLGEPIARRESDGPRQGRGDQPPSDPN